MESNSYFPRPVMKKYDMEIEGPDAFVTSILDLHPEKAIEVFHSQVNRLSKPACTADGVIVTLEEYEIKKCMQFALRDD